LTADVALQVLPKQAEFLVAKEREVLYSGAFGAGKTRALCLKAAIRASHPGAREFLCRKTNVSLKRTTLQTLLKPDGDLPAVLPEGTYRHLKGEQTISIIGGGEIVYGGLDDPAKIGSLQITGVAVDEAIEITEDDWTMLRGRIRVQVGTLSNQLYAATNPGAPSHHLAKRFGLGGDDAESTKCKAIVTCSDDNFFLPADYLEDLNTFQGVAKARFVRGLWVAAEGLVYPALLDCFIPHMEAPEGVNVGGIDFGWRNPFCALWGTVYEADDRMVLYVWGERYEAMTPIDVHAAAIKGVFPLRDCQFAADTEDPEAIRALRVGGVKAVKAKKAITSGIDAVNGAIGGLQLYISEDCVNLRKEAEVYCYSDKDLKEKPVGSFNHAMDALRYMVVHAKRRRLFEVEDDA